MQASAPASATRTRKAPAIGTALGKLVLYVLLIALALLTLFPFYWMFVLATHAQTDIFSAPPPLWFGEFLGRNYEALIARLPFLRNIWNSVYIALMATVTTLFFCSLGGFGFAMYTFRFKRVLFAILIVSLMIPPLLGIIPYYLIIQWLGWLDTPRAVWFPGMASAFGIFLMRQYIASAISRELMDAARIDGASEFRIYWNIVLPLIRPGLATLGLLTFIGQWNNFLGPLVVLNSRENYTIPLALRTLQGQIQTDWGAVLFGTALAVVPLLIIFVFASRQVIDGLTAGSVKG
ncbi:carbohydrate ABC transporter permease [Truepera radiovictrix]|uniref:Binding-protein-dependent transport systems inner membrane component n=1 Tax=Truepera radiovictrix (strain DSM 17093 / CIP 108686 / LMG 22925 / RQ-24) TaxID=649638 RepID=D7CRC6_TRURR|nr:carbohydrate ABC transporter permease [Truepera radiovictrix]ADI15214.1 binding-protein-dependent transport systems inner membrane component [Truepera radiovictrix DSM 17093]WMT56235.1 carbohydrate ABC transporter permease [Truepera radiovictrix]